MREKPSLLRHGLDDSSRRVPVKRRGPAATVIAVAGVILASGESRRFGEANKLLAGVGGEAIVRRTVRAFVEAGLHPVAVVVGFQATAIASALEGLELTLVRNPDFREGQSASLRRGIAAVREADGAVIGVADQPLLSAQVIRDLVREWNRSRSTIVIPRYGGTRGNPVLFSRELFGELATVRGDVGGRAVIAAHPREVRWLDVDDPRIGADVDSLESYWRLREDFGG